MLIPHLPFEYHLKSTACRLEEQFPHLGCNNINAKAELAVLKGRCLTFHLNIHSKCRACRAEASSGCLGLPVGVGHKCSLQMGSGRQLPVWGAANVVQHLWKQKGEYMIHDLQSTWLKAQWACVTAYGLSCDALQNPYLEASLCLGASWET